MCQKRAPARRRSAWNRLGVVGPPSSTTMRFQSPKIDHKPASRSSSWLKQNAADANVEWRRLLTFTLCRRARPSRHPISPVKSFLQAVSPGAIVVWLSSSPSRVARLHHPSRRSKSLARRIGTHSRSRRRFRPLAEKPPKVLSHLERSFRPSWRSAQPPIRANVKPTVSLTPSWRLHRPNSCPRSRKLRGEPNESARLARATTNLKYSARLLRMFLHRRPRSSRPRAD